MRNIEWELRHGFRHDGGNIPIVSDVINFGADLLGLPNEQDMIDQQNAANAAAQADMEASMAAESAANQAFMEEEARRGRINSITDTRAHRKAQLLKQRKKLAGSKAAAKRGSEGSRITGIAAQRGGTGALKSGAASRGSSTNQDYGKWGTKTSGLNLSLRGGSAGGKRPS
jgi:hypothetical protein